MNNYEKTKDFWNKLFSESYEKLRNLKVENSLRSKVFDEGLKWVSDGTVLDFGCGTAVPLFRCTALGAAKIIGIDISEKGIETAKKVAEELRLVNISKFITGGIEILKDYETGSIDGVILSNIIDNLLPSDARMLLHESHRILKNDGKLLLKLNDFYKDNVFEDGEAEEVSNNFFKEKIGLYFWNMEERVIEDLTEEYFNIKKYFDVPFPDCKGKERLFFLQKR